MTHLHPLPLSPSSPLPRPPRLPLPYPSSSPPLSEGLTIMCTTLVVASPGVSLVSRNGFRSSKYLPKWMRRIDDGVIGFSRAESSDKSVQVVHISSFREYTVIPDGSRLLGGKLWLSNEAGDKVNVCLVPVLRRSTSVRVCDSAVVEGS